MSIEQCGYCFNGSITARRRRRFCQGVRVQRLCKKSTAVYKAADSL